MLFLFQACGNSENSENQAINNTINTISENTLEMNSEKPNNPPPGDNNPTNNQPPGENNPPPPPHDQEKWISTELYKFLRMQMMIS